MGIFFDTCDALIDPSTGRALTGDALESAQRDPKWPRCGNRVSKRARFCNSCGKPAPGGWWKCPACNKWVGNDSQFCPHCNQPLYPDDRAAMAGGVWRKEPEHFAQRFEVGDIRRELTGDLLVQEGTVAVLMDGGEVNHILQAGRHNVDSLARSVNWFGNPPPRSVVLVDIGEIIVPLHMEGLRTSEHFPIEFFGEVMLRFKGDKDSARAFVANILRQNRCCTFRELSANFERSVRIAVDEVCVASTLDDLVRDPERRIRLHERMTTRLKGDLDACGLEVVRVSSAEFTGDEYEVYEQKLGDVDIQRREVEYRAALRRMADKEEMDKYKDADALRAYKESIDHEFRVSHATRDREFELLKRDWAHDDAVYQRLLELEGQGHRHELEDREQAHRHGQEDRQVDHDISVGGKKDSYERGKKVEDARADVTAQDLHTQQDIKDAQGWLGVKAEKQRLHIEAKAADAERRSGMTIENLLADMEDPQQREQMLKLYQMKLQAGMTPQQILATMGKTDHNDEFLAKMQELFKENAARIDANYAKSMEPAIEAARHPSNVTGPFIK